MLFKAKTLETYKLDSLDGEMGKVREFYFDDQHWTVRYLVADTGNWLPGRRVLISPYALVAAIKEDHHIAIDLTKEQIENSPSLESDQPVSRQFEQAYAGYYGWPSYWGGQDTWGGFPTPMIYPSSVDAPELELDEDRGDTHLRSTAEVGIYNVLATDGEIGHVEDFIIDDETWAIRYLVVNTSNWWLGKKVLISPQWIQRVSWEESQVIVNLTQEAIKSSPEYSEAALITEDYEAGLFGHYGFKDHSNKGKAAQETSFFQA